MRIWVILTLASSLTLTACYVTSTGVATENQLFKGKYDSFLAPGERPMYTWYHYMTSETVDGKYVRREFFPEKNLMTSYTTFTSPKERTRNGPAMQWYDDGERKSEGHYVNDLAEGEWSYYTFISGAKSTGQYRQGEKTGVWKGYDNKGRLTSETTYAFGLRQGRFVKYDSLSNIIKEGIYQTDTILQQTTGVVQDTLFRVVEQMPRFADCSEFKDEVDIRSCSNRALLRYIYSSIKYPPTAREYGVDGTAIATFVIEKDGTVTDLRMMHGICESISNECYRVVNQMPKWHTPGMQDGEPVRVQFNLPIKFILE